jgi:hypothetical protein
MAQNYVYLLVDPHKPGMLAIKGAFHHKYEAISFAKQNGYSDKDTQLWRILSRFYVNQMNCCEIKDWLGESDVQDTLRKTDAEGSLG